MSITIKENEHPPLKHTPMIVDSCIHEKLNKYEVLSHLNHHSTNLLIGKPKSGKSSLLYSLFNSKHALKKAYHYVVVFMPSSSRSSISKDIFETLPEDQKFDELTYENLAFVLENIKAKPKHQNKCIIFDDMAAYLKDPPLQQLFKSLVWNRRHIGVSIYFLSQTYLAVPKELRRCFTNLFIFKVPIDSMRTIFHELVEVDPSLILPIMQVVYDKPYNFLMINLESLKLYRNWDELIF